jgi:hypothetical protein
MQISHLYPTILYKAVSATLFWKNIRNVSQRLLYLNTASFTHSSSYSSSISNSRFQLRYPISFLSTSAFNILFHLSICVSYPDKKVMNSFQTFAILHSVFLHHYSSLLWSYAINITTLLILAHKCRSHILQLNFALSIHVRVCQHLLRTSLKQNPLTVYMLKPRQRYLTAEATAPHLPETKKTNKIGFTMSLCILKINIF